MKTEANTYILTKLKTKEPLSTYLVIDKWSTLLNKFKYENFTTKFIDGSKTPPRFDISKMKLIENTPEDTKEILINFNKVEYIPCLANYHYCGCNEPNSKPCLANNHPYGCNALNSKPCLVNDHECGCFSYNTKPCLTNVHF